MRVIITYIKGTPTWQACAGSGGAAVGIAERPLRGAASRTTAGGDDPRSKRALCLLAMDDRRGYLS